MDPVFRFAEARAADPAVAQWFAAPDPLRALLQPWHARLRACGADTRELIHDGRPTICVGVGAYAYLDAFGAHAAIGFFFGAELQDPFGLLEGSGKRMRHVKLRSEAMPDGAALSALITAAYADISSRL
jgi:hypothetical protein